MQTQYIDVYYSKKINDDIYEILNIDAHTIDKKYKRLQQSANKNRIYVKKNLRLEINDHGKKSYTETNVIDSTYIGNSTAIKYNAKRISSFEFPIITKYDDVIVQSIFPYEKGIYFITEKSNKTGTTTNFIRLNNVNELDKIDLLESDIFN